MEVINKAGLRIVAMAKKQSLLWGKKMIPHDFIDQK